MPTLPSIAQGGCRIRNRRFADQDITGTMACLVASVDAPDQLYVLSAAHVMNPGGYAFRDDVIEAELSTGWTEIAQLSDWSPLRDASGTRYDHDAAIARVTAPQRVAAGVLGVGDIVDVARWAYAGKPLRVVGGESRRLVEATVYDVDRDAPVYYDDWASQGVFALPFQHLILYGLAVGNTPAMIPGDSGALVLDNNGLAVGLHIARTDDQYPQRASVCTPIDAVLSAFGIAIVTAPPRAGPASAPAPAPVIPTALPLPTAQPVQPAPPAGTAPAAAAPAPATAATLDADEISARGLARCQVFVMPLLKPHTVFGGCRWQLTPEGLVVDGRLDRSGGKLVTVPRVWATYRALIVQAAQEFKVPIELILATLCTESGGNPEAFRREPDGRVSVGLMQTLTGTAQDMLPDETINAQTLRDPLLSLRAGTAYIANQRQRTGFDPPQVACAYNAGSVRLNDSAANRWRMAQYPLGSSAHADRFVQWFNDCFAWFSTLPTDAPAPDATEPSFWGLFRN